MSRLHPPWIWLLVQAAALWGVLHASGHTALLNVSGDSELYLQIARRPLPNTFILRCMVPPGYPLFLKAVGGLERILAQVGLPARDLAALPLCHFAVHAAAVLVFYAGLASVVSSRWLALA